MDTLLRNQCMSHLEGCAPTPNLSSSIKLCRRVSTCRVCVFLSDGLHRALRRINLSYQLYTIALTSLWGYQSCDFPPLKCKSANPALHYHLGPLIPEPAPNILDIYEIDKWLVGFFCDLLTTVGLTLNDFFMRIRRCSKQSRTY